MLPPLPTSVKSIPVHGDALLDVDERTFTVRLSNPLSALLERTDATGTVLYDEDCPGPTLVANGGAEKFPVYGKLASWREQAGTSWQRRFAEPAPEIAVVDPSPERAEEKRRFESDRRALVRHIADSRTAPNTCRSAPAVSVLTDAVRRSC